jgi:CheY-like chemotaxis protein
VENPGNSLPLVFLPTCPLLALQKAHLERCGGFQLTDQPSPECRVLICCADHVGTHEAAVASLDAPKLVVGADPPASWRNAERLERPLLPLDLETRVNALLEGRPAVPSSYRVLIVDDDAVVRAAAESAFSRAGFEARSVGGFASVQTEMKRRPDVVLMDLSLPGLSGEKLGEILRRQGVPIVVFSSAGPERLEAARASIGAIAAFAKGVSLSLVAAQVRQHLDAVRAVSVQ